MSNKPQTSLSIPVNTTGLTNIVRLDPEVYATLEAKLISPHVSNETTPIQAGFQLGVQAVLKELRRGYVVSAR